MKTMNLDKVSITGEIEFKKVLEFDLKAKVNNHASLEVFGMVDKDYEEQISRLIGKSLLLSCEIEEENVPIFAGKIQEAEMSFAGEECYIRLKCIDASHEFDKVRVCRSYQDKHMTYRQLLDIVATQGHNMLLISDQRAEMGTPLIQYEETDWEFCKRIAGRLHTIVIPEITGSYPQLAVGVIQGKNYRLEDCDTYELYQDLEGYRRKRRFCQCYVEDFSIYTISCDRDYRLGDKVQFLDRQFIVLSKHFYSQCSKVEMKYELGSEKTKSIEPHYNPKICGLSLEGTVQETTEEKIKVNLDIDKNQISNAKQLYDFDYVPVSGNLMYSMPEKGTKVQLYFPSEEERTGMVVGSKHEETDYPKSSHKVFHTKEGKKFELNPEQIVCKSLSNYVGLELADDRGMQLYSDKKVHIYAQKNIKINTGNIANYDTPLGYHFENKKSKDSMDIAGNEILIATERAVISALPHKLGHKPKQVEVQPRISNPSQYIANVLGGIPRVDSLSPMVSSLLGGVAIYTNPSYQCNRKDMIFLGRK